MTDPLFWLVLSLLFVTISLTIVLAVAIPALKEVARAARSAEKLFDTLRREFPPTLESIRLTGMEISDLTDDVSEGVQSAGQVVKQVDQSLAGARKQAQKVQTGTRSVMAGVKAAWKTFTRPQKPMTQRRSLDRLPPTRQERELIMGNAPAADHRNNRRLTPEEIAAVQNPEAATQRTNSRSLDLDNGMPATSESLDDAVSSIEPDSQNPTPAYYHYTSEVEDWEVPPEEASREP